MYLSENLQKKWEGVLDHADLPSIKDPYRKAVTAVILENQAQEMQKTAGMLYEAPATNSMGSTNGGFQGGSAAAGPGAGFDPILISLVRRSLPNLIAYDICGVQPSRTVSVVQAHVAQPAAPPLPVTHTYREDLRETTNVDSMSLC